MSSYITTHKNLIIGVAVTISISLAFLVIWRVYKSFQTRLQSCDLKLQSHQEILEKIVAGCPYKPTKKVHTVRKSVIPQPTVVPAPVVHDVIPEEHEEDTTSNDESDLDDEIRTELASLHQS